VRKSLLGTAALVAVVAIALPGERAAAATEAAALQASFPSRALARPVPFSVYLPAGYATSKLRYPVVYFLHGLPASGSAYLGAGWVAQTVAQLGRRAIVVVPQGASDKDTDPEYHDWGPGENWETALGVELPEYVDAHYRTVAKRSGRAIVGVSAGGYGAAIIGAHHPATYSVVEAWSGYFEPTDPTGKTTLDLGSDDANAKANLHRLVPALKAEFARYPTLFAFYVGRSDPTFVPSNVLLDAELTAAGVPHLFRLYAGGHDDALWRSHARPWLSLALGRLSGPELTAG
jgi:enterochelin esterase-like enzyme